MINNRHLKSLISRVYFFRKIVEEIKIAEKGNDEQFVKDLKSKKDKIYEKLMSFISRINYDNLSEGQIKQINQEIIELVAKHKFLKEVVEIVGDKYGK